MAAQADVNIGTLPPPATGGLPALPHAIAPMLRSAGLGVADPRWCVLRAPAPEPGARGVTEVDLLVATADLGDIEAGLARVGFARRPGWGRAPHHFHVAPFSSADVPTEVGAGPSDRPEWVKLDLVTDVCFGAWHELPTGVARRCLDAAAVEGDWRRLAPGDELSTLLLHCVLDRHGFRDRDRHQLRALLGVTRDGGALGADLDHRRPGSWAVLADAVEQGRWAELLSSAPDLWAVLRSGRRWTTARRRAGNTIARRSAKVLTATSARGPLVALLGPDGTGKSTLAAGVAGSSYLPARVLYGGTHPAGMWRSPVPGLTTAGVLGRLGLTRLAIAGHRRRGRLVVLDRHPCQVLPTSQQALPRRTRWRRRLLAAALPKPDLAVVLDAPGPVLHARRPEHDIARLEADRQAHRRLADRLPSVAVVDATVPERQLRREVTALIWNRCVVSPVARATDLHRDARR